MAINPFRIDVNQPHHHRRQRIFQIPHTGVTAAFGAAWCQPLFLRAPVGVFFWMPNIFPAKTKPKNLQTRSLVGNGTGINQQVGPAQGIAIFFLDRPQQPASFIQIDVIGPRVQGRKTLVTGATATAAIGDTVGTSCVPRHAHHQAHIVTPVGRPPRLAIGHQGVQIFFQGGNIELFQLFSIIERGPHGIGLGVVLVQDVQIERLGPPIGIGHSALGRRPVHNRALTTVMGSVL